MQKLTITNKGNKTIKAPQITLNNRNWYTSKTLAEEAIIGATTLRDSLLNIWRFVRDNRLHDLPSCYDDYVFYKMLAVYGYGTCDVATNNVIGIAEKVGFHNQVGISLPHHTTAEIIYNDKGAILDSDIEVFYLMFDNKDLSGSAEVFNDKYLIYRTKHYGLSDIYAKETDQWLAALYSNEVIAERNYSQVINFDFNLRPDETIFFSWDLAAKYYQNWKGNVSIPDFFLHDIISNSKYILKTDFKNINLDELFSNIENLFLNTDDITKPKLQPSADSASFIYQVDLPFPILDAKIIGKFLNNNIDVYISKNQGYSWNNVWHTESAGILIDTIPLNSYLNYPLLYEGQTPTYSYWLRFDLLPQDDYSNCGVDSLYIENTIQISKFFLPALNLGCNTLHYQDSEDTEYERNIEVKINWQECSDNKPPNKVNFPIFPLNNANVDSLYFAFTWEPVTDDDGDDVVDYEFMLSNDDRMLYPHSPNFNLYVSAFGEGVKPYFKVKETGWLNDGETYYWRVRAKDARGAWSEWSDTWSFTPHGVMRPVNGKAEIAGQSIKLGWDRNPTGRLPDFYKIYASDEMNGFSPREITFFATSDSTEFIIPFDYKESPFSFYRISACDTLGQESLISDVIEIPYPYMYAAYDSVRMDSLFTMNLFSNEKFYPYYYYAYYVDSYVPKITVESKPDWLSYDPAGILYSTDSNLAQRLVYMDSLQRTVILSLDDGWGNIATQTIVVETVAVNNKPALMLSDSTVCEGSLFSAYITSTDGDVNKYGDTHIYTVLQKPDWLNYEIKGDTVHLSGIPLGNPLNGFTCQDSLLHILAVDSKNESTSMELLIHVTPHVRILSAIKDTAIEDQPYSYVFRVNRKENEIVSSFLTLPQWLHINGAYQVSGIPNISNLSDTILHIATYDKVCNVFAGHEITISIQHVNHPPLITTTDLPAYQSNVPYQAKIKAHDIDSLIEDVYLSYYMLPASSWLTLDDKTGEIKGMPLLLNQFTDLTFEFTVFDKQGATDSKVITIPYKQPDMDIEKDLYCQIVRAEQEYYAKLQSTKDALFRYQLYSIDGTLLYSSVVQNITEGTHFLPIDMNKYPNGIYLFVGFENNSIIHSIKFMKL